MAPPLNSARDIFRVKRRAGLRKVVGGLDYARCVEYPAVLERLELDDARRVLEIGASKLFLGCYIAVRYDAEVHVTDSDPVVWLQRKWIARVTDGKPLAEGRFVVAQEDATKLSYPDASFDRVVGVSTIEHIREVDTAAEEIGRVLRPGGIAVLTVPFSLAPREVWVDHDLYGQRYEGTSLFYEYRFDLEMLERRVIGPSGLRLRSLTFLGEPGFKMTRLVYHRVLGHPLSLLRWIWPYAAHRWYREIAPKQVSDGWENIAVLALEKPGA